MAKQLRAFLVDLFEPLFATPRSPNGGCPAAARSITKSRVHRWGNDYCAMQDVQVEGGFLGRSLGGPLTESRSINVIPPPASEKLHRLKSISLGRERASPNSGDRDESPTAGSGPAAFVLPKDLQVLSAELAHPASTDILAAIGILQKSGPADARTSRSALLRAGACYLAHDAESAVSAHAGQARKLARARLHLAFHEVRQRKVVLCSFLR